MPPLDTRRAVVVVQLLDRAAPPSCMASGFRSPQSCTVLGFHDAHEAASGIRLEARLVAYRKGTRKVLTMTKAAARRAVASWAPLGVVLYDH